MKKKRESGSWEGKEQEETEKMVWVCILFLFFSFFVKLPAGKEKATRERGK